MVRNKKNMWSRHRSQADVVVDFYILYGIICTTYVYSSAICTHLPFVFFDWFPSTSDPKSFQTNCLFISGSSSSLTEASSPSLHSTLCLFCPYRTISFYSCPHIPLLFPSIPLFSSHSRLPRWILCAVSQTVH